MNPDSVGALLDETIDAHHLAFADVDGYDPEWPLWYAEYMQGKLIDSFGLSITKSELVYFLVDAEIKRSKMKTDKKWTRVYADLFIDKYQIESEDDLERQK